MGMPVMDEKSARACALFWEKVYGAGVDEGAAVVVEVVVVVVVETSSPLLTLFWLLPNVDDEVVGVLKNKS